MIPALRNAIPSLDRSTAAPSSLNSAAGHTDSKLYPKETKDSSARVRDNQRRSRARKKEYLQDLETKYQACAATGVTASIQIQNAARRVLDENSRLNEENRKLRGILLKFGIADDQVATAIRENDNIAEEGLVGVQQNIRHNAIINEHGLKLDGQSSLHSPFTAAPPLSGDRLASPAMHDGHRSDAASELELLLNIRHPCGPSTVNSQQLLQTHVDGYTDVPSIRRDSSLDSESKTNYSPSNMAPSPIPTMVMNNNTMMNTRPNMNMNVHTNMDYTPPNHASYSHLAYPMHHNSPISPSYNTQMQNQMHLMPSPVQNGQILPTQVFPPETTSCLTAASTIRAMRPDLTNAMTDRYLQTEMGCRPDVAECRVPNARVFSVMDRYSNT